ncbi:MAG: hypothetical protein CMQ46_05655 [Gammaproteobacteria bacterium]|nr:hypothetical protein [Gammaproteobacteria bacterium]MBJ54730.1 hypothetical protein [Gammaproteobacteria bacterium]HBN16159.1 hypothetical protein [Pseudohongiella sp.]|tara:strand:- start:266 stop:568 length:303 start_codon:yes stop_codon:yes gene_type:complete
MIRSKKITDAARGQQCLINIAGVCNYDPETAVFCHFPDESHGTSLKSDDISGGFGCSDCHDVVDGRVKSDEWRAHKLFYMRRAQTRTIRALFEMGVIQIV